MFILKQELNSQEYDMDFIFSDVEEVKEYIKECGYSIYKIDTDDYMGFQMFIDCIPIDGSNKMSLFTATEVKFWGEVR